MSLFYGGAWEPRTVYERATIDVSRGSKGEGSIAPPSEATCTLDNRSGENNPRNPASPLYGAAGRNTPMRVTVAGSTRSTTEAASWAPQRSIDKRDAWTPIVGGGIMRRLEQGNTPIRSVAYRALSAAANDATRVAYWPVEEQSGATALSGTPGAVITSPVALGQDAVSASSERLAVLGDGGALTFLVPAYNSTESKVVGLFKYPTSELPDGTVVMRCDCQGGSIDRFELKYSTGFGLRIEFVSGETIVETLGPVAWSTWIGDGGEVFSTIELTQNGANIDVLHQQVRILTGQIGTPTDTVTGHTLGRIWRITVQGNGLAFGQLAVGNDTGAFPNWISPTNGTLGTRGYTGELAGDRAIRLGDEEGIPVVWIGDENDTQPMGPQPVLPFLDLVRECALVDDGIMFEPVDDLGIAVRGGRDLYNRSSVLTLDFSTRGISHPLAPVLDDRGTQNDVTAKRRNGSSYRAQKLTGPLNVNNPIDDPEGVGRYDTQVDVNTVDDAALIGQAWWRVHRGTIDETRYPAITVDLVAAPSLVADVEAVDIGDRITVTGLPVDWQQGDAELVVLGISERIGTHTRTVSFNTIPASAFEVGIVGTGDGSVDVRGARVDARNSTLAGDLDETSGTFGVNSPTGPGWTTNPDDWSTSLHGSGPWGPGLFIVIGGEVMRVTGISGSGTQPFTVVRSVNGVVKEHLAGAPVHVATPVRVGL